MDTLVGSRSGTLSKSPMMGRDKERLKLNLSEHRMRFLGTFRSTFLYRNWRREVKEMGCFRER